MEIIKINNLTKKYGKTLAVDHLNLTIQKGELFSLLGINGAGKSTTIKMLSCIVKPTEGDAFLDNKSITFNTIDVKRIIGFSPQETAVAQNLTVKENLEMICCLHDFSKEKRKQKLEEFITQFELDAVINKKAGKLSGGYQRRLSIAMALISEPQILFLDEPTLGLDVIARKELWTFIESLKGKITIILTTHYLEETDALSDRIGIMKSGKLIALGTSEELKKQTKEDKFEDAFIKIIEGESK